MPGFHWTSTKRVMYTCCTWAGGTFYPVVLLCQFLVLAGNRFWFYILMYLEGFNRNNFFHIKTQNIPFLPQKRYLQRSAWRNKTMFKTMFVFSVQGSRHIWTLIKNIVLNIVSLPPLNHPPSVLVVVLVIVLLSCCSRCLCLLCCHVANTAAATTIGTLPPPPLLLAGVEVDACYTNADSSPATLLQIEQRKKSGTKIQHGLRRPPNTNKNATTNQKHTG
jgi:hypothetical protein